MTIKEKLTGDMKEAMKVQDKISLATIRMLIDRIQKKEKDLLRDATEEEVVQVLQTFKKQVEEEADAFASAGKFSREAVLIDSIALVRKYLPEQLSYEEVLEGVKVIAVLSPGANKGELMKKAMGEFKGRTDNRFINQAVDEVLKG